MSREPAEIVLVPCPDSGRAGCAIARRAAELVAREAPEVAVVPAEACPRGARQYVLAIEGSSACSAEEALRACGCRAAAVVSAPAVLARMGMLRPGAEVRAHAEELAGALAGAIRESLSDVLEEVQERRRYREAMEPVMRRFAPIWERVGALAAPDGAADEEDRRVVELLGKRARNLFSRLDEISPPALWSEPHDLFQDALLCVAYACEGWVSGDAGRWEQNLEKARVQVVPLLRRLGIPDGREAEPAGGTGARPGI